MTLMFLFQIKNTSNEQELNQIVENEEFDFLYDCGIQTRSITMAKKDDVISAIAKHYCIVICKAELDQLIEGLSTLQVLDLVRSNPDVMRELFIYVEPKKLSSDYIIDLFTPSYSPQGCNRREFEEAAVMKWIQFIEIIEGVRITTTS